MLLSEAIALPEGAVAKVEVAKQESSAASAMSVWISLTVHSRLHYGTWSAVHAREDVGRVEEMTVRFNGLFPDVAIVHLFQRTGVEGMLLWHFG